MKLILSHRLTAEASACPYRVVDEQGKGTVWANDFLDAQHMRQRNLSAPMLVIVGGRDVLLDSAHTKRRLEKHAPGAQVVYLPEAGHLISGEMSRVLEFLRGVEPAQADRA
jgi:pimeloyl-ACP methyl ester carboxylesterase